MAVKPSVGRMVSSDNRAVRLRACRNNGGLPRDDRVRSLCVSGYLLGPTGGREYKFSGEPITT